MASKDHLEDVKREVMVVSELIDILSGEQKYLQRKLDRHIKTVVRWLDWLHVCTQQTAGTWGGCLAADMCCSCLCPSPHTHTHTHTTRSGATTRARFGTPRSRC
jgi:hypothetical protein